MNLNLSDDLLDRIKKLTKTKEVDGKTYMRIDKITMSAKGAKFYCEDNVLLEMKGDLDPRMTALTIEKLDALVAFNIE